MATKAIKLDETTAKRIYKTATPELRAILEENFEKKTLTDKVIDRIQNFDDILNEIDEELDNVIPWVVDEDITKKEISQNAAAKLQAIADVYNEGFVFDWTDSSQPKFAPYWRREARGWVLRDVGADRYFAYLGSGFYFKTRELAEDAAKKFKDIYLEYLPE